MVQAAVPCLLRQRFLSSRRGQRKGLESARIVDATTHKGMRASAHSERLVVLATAPKLVAKLAEIRTGRATIASFFRLQSLQPVRPLQPLQPCIALSFSSLSCRRPTRAIYALARRAALTAPRMVARRLAPRGTAPRRRLRPHQSRRRLRRRRRHHPLRLSRRRRRRAATPSRLAATRTHRRIRPPGSPPTTGTAPPFTTAGPFIRKAATTSSTAAGAGW